MDTKTQILDNALHLFNTEGVETISTRHIASRMGISVGNLHYHFATKGVVILKLLGMFIQRSNQIAGELSTTALDSGTIRKTLTQTFVLIYEFRFLFNERLWLSRRFPEVEEMFAKMIEGRRMEFNQQVAWLKAEGLIRSDLPEQQYQFLFDHIIILYNSWSAHLNLLAPKVENTEDVVNAFVEIISAIWLPYFTENGRQLLSPAI